MRFAISYESEDRERGPPQHAAGRESRKIGHGRMYSGVPPIEGTFAGDAEREIEALVTMTRVAAGPPADRGVSAARTS